MLCAHASRQELYVSCLCVASDEQLNRMAPERWTYGGIILFPKMEGVVFEYVGAIVADKYAGTRL